MMRNRNMLKKCPMPANKPAETVTHTVYIPRLWLALGDMYVGEHQTNPVGLAVSQDA